MKGSNNKNILKKYQSSIEGTDEFIKDELTPVLLGLYGEVGSVLSNYKKRCREKASFTGYHDADIEEFGDVIWYFTAICNRFNLKIDTVFSNALPEEQYKSILSSKNASKSRGNLKVAAAQRELSSSLIELGKTAASFLKITSSQPPPNDLLSEFVIRLTTAIHAAKIPLSDILDYNSKKTRGRFVEPTADEMPAFDLKEHPDEQIPDSFEITIKERKNGKTHLQWRGVFIGDPLTDNIKGGDGYRFHDVFHFAYAAILHWSPVFRALIKQKRKENSNTDEEQDSGRALVVEEGLTAWIFSQAKRKEIDFFKTPDTRVSFDMLKTIQQFVSGYEVEKCPLYLWEKAVLEGYRVFRLVRDNKGGTVVCDKINRTIAYRPPEGK